MIRADVAEIFSFIEEQPNKAFYVVNHTYEPRNDINYLNDVQYRYPRKNWSSVVLWNCADLQNKKLTPEFFNTTEGLEMHRFTWLKDTEID